MKIKNYLYFYKLKRMNLKITCLNWPQKKGYCIKVFKLSPKKPNSAKRRVARVRLTNKKYISVYIPGIGDDHNVQRFSTVLIRGGRVQDLPGVHYKVIRNKYDCSPVSLRRTARSKYGVKKWIN